MTQAPFAPSVQTGAEEQFALIDRREKNQEWFCGLMVTAILLLWIIGGILLLL